VERGEHGAVTHAAADRSTAHAASSTGHWKHAYPGWPGWPGGTIAGKGFPLFHRDAHYDWEIHWRGFVINGDVYIRPPIGNGGDVFIGVISRFSTPESPQGTPTPIAAVDVINGLTNDSAKGNGWTDVPTNVQQFGNWLGDRRSAYKYRNGPLLQPKCFVLSGVLWNGGPAWGVEIGVHGTKVPRGEISELNDSGVFSGIAHTFLDLASLVPGVGVIAAISNVCLDIAEGKDWTQISVDGLAAIPGEKYVEIAAWSADHLAEVELATNAIGAYIAKHEINTAQRIYALYDAAKNIRDLGEKRKRQQGGK
jgi:hypothetical protein